MQKIKHINNYPELYKALKRINAKNFYWYIQQHTFVITTEKKKYLFSLSNVSELEAIFIIDSAIKYLRTKTPEQLTMFADNQHPPPPREAHIITKFVSEANT